MPKNGFSQKEAIRKLQLPFSRYRFRFLEDTAKQKQPSTLKHANYLGSTWRGAFGNALRHAVCITRLPACDPCTLLNSCPYPNLFESRPPNNSRILRLYPRSPLPYVLEPEIKSYDSCESTLNLGFTLFGKSNEYFPYVVHALQAAGKKGLTSRKIRLNLKDIQIESDECEETNSDGWKAFYSPTLPLSTPPPNNIWHIPSLPTNLRVNFITPIRIKSEQRFVNESRFSFRALASNLLRRVSLLAYFYGENSIEPDFKKLLQQAEEIPVINAKLRWSDLSRYSSRQQTKLKMGGLVGSIELNHELLEPFLPYLWIGQWLHVGKGCTLGLGRYVIQPLEPIETQNEENQARLIPSRL